MRLTLVAAVAKNGVIGSQNSMPWYIPEDLKHFKDVTIGKTCLMGRNTFDSIMQKLGKPLPGRKNVVISRHTDWQVPDGVEVYSSVEDALENLQAEDEVMVTGGGQIYAQLIDQADKLIITHIHREIDGDVLFPEIDPAKWKKVSEKPHKEFSWTTYERIK
ncbi:MAG: dihydrofolate reductase [Candidatus Doudnabacteria bacterium]